MVMSIPLANDRGEALVDEADYELVAGRRWRLGATGGYAYTGTHPNAVAMHRLLMGDPPFENAEVDHINGNKLDNRRENLRGASRSQNVANTRKRNPEAASSRYKGVSWNADARRWAAYIRVEGRRVHLGYFAEEGKAALAYDEAAIEYFGEFAKLNFPEEVYQCR